jgi:gentisate 1,2-dioxygenase
MTNQAQASGPRKLPEGAREAMEKLNAEAGHLHIWLRTQANAPAQRPWFKETALSAGGQVASGKVGAGQLKALPYRWRWKEISPYLERIAEFARASDVPPIEFADRQQFLLTNPGLGGRLQIANAIRCAVSIYNPGDVAPVHLHTPNASRTILSETGGYTTVEGERCEARRGDLILTPNGTWHDHGNDASEPVVWVDVLDWPLLEFLDCIWLDEAFEGPAGERPRSQATVEASGYSGKLYGSGGLLPTFKSPQRGIGYETSPLIHYRGEDVRRALDGMRGETGDPYEGIGLQFTNPATGGPVFATMDYGAQLLRGGEETRFKRETASVMYIVLEGSGFTEVAGQRFDWEPNDIFVVPSFLWRRHVNTGASDAVLYTVSDRALMQRIGQHRAQGRAADDSVVALA